MQALAIAGFDASVPPSLVQYTGKGYTRYSTVSLTATNKGVCEKDFG